SALPGRWLIRPEGPESTKADHRDKITRAGSQRALSAQPLHLRFAHPEPAEDLGIVLAELGGDGAHPYTLADLDRGADVRHFAELRIARVLHEAAVAHLRVGEHLRVIVDRTAGHAGRLQHLHPMIAG